MTITVLSLVDRPDLRGALLGMTTTFPPFLDHDAWAQFGFGYLDDFAHFQLAVIEDDRLIGRGLSVPIAWDRPLELLPARGFDAAVELAVSGLRQGTKANLVVALEVAFTREAQGRGLSKWGFSQLLERSRDLDFEDVVVPLRPNQKHLHPHVGMKEYVGWTQDDGLPVDPWLRVHARLGGRILSVAPLSSVVTGTLREWSEWTGMEFTVSGPVVVPEALCPIHVSIEEDFAVYVEPNVWIHHDLRRTARSGVRQPTGC